MHFYIGRTRFTSKFSTLLTVTDPPVCCLGMLVTHLEFSSLVTLWKSSLNFSENSHTFYSVTSDTHPCIKMSHKSWTFISSSENEREL